MLLKGINSRFLFYRALAEEVRSQVMQGIKKNKAISREVQDE